MLTRNYSWVRIDANARFWPRDCAKPVWQIRNSTECPAFFTATLNKPPPSRNVPNHNAKELREMPIWGKLTLQLPVGTTDCDRREGSFGRQGPGQRVFERMGGWRESARVKRGLRQPECRQSVHPVVPRCLVSSTHQLQTQTRTQSVIRPFCTGEEPQRDMMWEVSANSQHEK